MTRLKRLAAALAVVTTRAPVAMASTPLELRNPLNGSGGTTKGARYATNARRRTERTKGETLALRLEQDMHGVNPGNLPTHFCVVLTRVSPRSYDDDGTTAALKSVRDGMAGRWGIDDADERVTWVCDWRKGEHHVVEAALWAVPTDCTCGACIARYSRKPAPSQPEFDASNWERPVLPPVLRKAKP